MNLNFSVCGAVRSGSSKSGRFGGFESSFDILVTVFIQNVAVILISCKCFRRDKVSCIFVEKGCPVANMLLEDHEDVSIIPSTLDPFNVPCDGNNMERHFVRKIKFKKSTASSQPAYLPDMFKAPYLGRSNGLLPL